MYRGQERYIIGCVDAGTEQMEAILEAAKQETEGSKAEEAVMRGRAVVAGRSVSEDCASPSIVGGTLADTDGMASETENAVSGVGEATTVKNWSTPGSRSLILDEAGADLVVKAINKGEDLVLPEGHIQGGSGPDGEPAEIPG